MPWEPLLHYDRSRVKEDHSVTLRERDSMKQHRVPIDSISEIISEKVNMKMLF